jgi:acetyl-CoA acyltransferase
VIIGCAMPEGEQGMNVARIGALLAGLPDAVPAQTINRFCSSGLQAVALAADRIRLGEAGLVLAGGVESMSMVPMMGNKVAMTPSVFEDDNVAIAYGMGITAEKVAEQWKVFARGPGCLCVGIAPARTGRDRQRRLQVRDHALQRGFPPAHAGQQRGRRARSLVSQDEGPRPDTSAEGLAKLKPVFRMGGSVTAGNSSQMSDGAGAVLLASEQAIKDYGLTPLARFVGFSVAGVKPEVMGIGPKEAIPKALRQAGLSQEQMDWIELNEAFAAQALAVVRELGLDPAKVNPLGGAIALGHPLGATGAVRVATLVHGLRRRQQKYGMVTMCIGTGMGAAVFSKRYKRR